MQVQDQGIDLLKRCVCSALRQLLVSVQGRKGHNATDVITVVFICFLPQNLFLIFKFAK